MNPLDGWPERMQDADVMPHRVYDPNAFSERVSYARQCLLADDTDRREFDTCFEMFDGDLVMVRLLQEAESDERLRLPLKRYGIGWVRRELYPLLKSAGPNEIERLAQTLRDRFRGDAHAMWPHLCSGD